MKAWVLISAESPQTGAKVNTRWYRCSLKDALLLPCVLKFS